MNCSSCSCLFRLQCRPVDLVRGPVFKPLVPAPLIVEVKVGCQLPARLRHALVGLQIHLQAVVREDTHYGTKWGRWAVCIALLGWTRAERGARRPASEPSLRRIPPETGRRRRRRHRVSLGPSPRALAVRSMLRLAYGGFPPEGGAFRRSVSWGDEGS